MIESGYNLVNVTACGIVRSKSSLTMIPLIQPVI